MLRLPDENSDPVTQPTRITETRPSAQAAATPDQLGLNHRPVEEALHPSEEYLNGILSSLDEIVWSTSALRPQKLYLSPAAEAVFGRPVAAFFDDPNLWWEIIHPDDRPAVESWRKTRRESGSVEMEYRIVRPDGELRWLHDRSHIVRDASGAAVRIDGIIHDITARRQAEEAERQQWALAEALRDTIAALNSTLHLDEVLDRVLLNVGRVVPHDAAAILLSDAQRSTARVARYHDYLDQNREAVILGVNLSIADTRNLRIMTETGQPMVIPDTRAYDGWVERSASDWMRSYAGTPICLKTHIIGFLNLYSNTPNFFTTTHLERLQAFADQAAIALENGRLFTEAQRRLTEQTLLLAASNAISSSLDLTFVLNRLAEHLGQAIGATSAYIGDWQPANNAITVLAEYVDAQASPNEHVSDLGVTYSLANDFGEAFRRQLLSGAAFAFYVDDPHTPEALRAHLMRYGGWSLLCIPLSFKQTIIGYAELWDSRCRRTFTVEEVALCQGIAQHAAMALENARLFEAERQHRQEIEAVQQASLSLTASLDLQQVLGAILSAVLNLTPARSAGIFLHLDGQLVFGSGLTPAGPLSQPQLGAYAESAAQLVARTGQPAVAEDLVRHPLFVDGQTESSGALVSLPLKIGPDVVGVMTILYAAARRFRNAELRALELLAAQAAIAIHNAHLHAQVQRHAAELERRVAERTAELENERRRVEAILNAAAEGITVTDRQSVIQYSNPAMERITGYTATELLGQTPRVMRSGLTPVATYQAMGHALAHGDLWQGEMINRRKDGRLYDAALIIAPLRDERDEVIGFVGSQWDITHLKELDRLKNQFVSRIGHELLTPLANLKLYLELLENGKPDKREQYLRVLARETERLRRLTEGFLEISHLDAGAVTSHLAPTDLNHLIVDLSTDQKALAAERGLTLTYQLDPALPQALADPVLTNRAIANLLENALNYTPPGGDVALTTAVRRQADQAWVTLAVRDSGPGLQPAEVPRLFERFYRGEAARDFTTPGAGLGLAIVKEIVDRLAGRITVESQPGQGATFILWLRMA